MAHWYVYRGDAPPLGPWTTEAVAEAILTGALAPGTLVAAPAGGRWLRAADAPVIARLLDGQPTKRAAELGVKPPAPGAADPPAASEPAARCYAGGDTLESPGNERPRR